MECIYGDLVAIVKRPQASPAAGAPGGKAGPSSRPRALPAKETSFANDGMFSNETSTLGEDLIIDNTNTQLSEGDDLLLNDLNMPEFSFNNLKSPTFEGLLGLDDHTSDKLQFLADASMIPYDNPAQQLGSWCSWMRPEATLSIMNENPMTRKHSASLAIFQLEYPHAQHSADLIIQSLRSFPTMMLRKETFPWFIHHHSHLLSQTAAATQPEALSTCMSVAQMFASRTFETKPFIWRTIKNEHRHFVTEVSVLTPWVLLC